MAIECDCVCAGVGLSGGRGRLLTHVHRASACRFECRGAPARVRVWRDARVAPPCPTTLCVEKFTLPYLTLPKGSCAARAEVGTLTSSHPSFGLSVFFLFLSFRAPCFSLAQQPADRTPARRRLDLDSAKVQVAQGQTVGCRVLSAPECSPRVWRVTEFAGFAARTAPATPRVPSAPASGLAGLAQAPAACSRPSIDADRDIDIATQRAITHADQRVPCTDDVTFQLTAHTESTLNVTGLRRPTRRPA